MYLIESPTLKGEVGVLVLFEFLQTLFYGLNRGLSNLYETATLITSSSAYGVISIGFSVIGSSFVHMKAKEKLNV